jgi:flagellar biogenesis protein FliO
MRDATAVNSPHSAAVANPNNNGASDATRVLLALAGVLGLIVVLRMALRRVFPGAISHRATRAIRILSRCIVSPRQHLLLIQVGKRLLVVGEGGAQLNRLCEITDDDEVAQILTAVREESTAAGRRFEHLFGRARKSFEEEPAPPATTEALGEAPAEGAFDPTHEINDPALCETHNELAGLSDKVRELARQLRRD